MSKNEYLLKVLYSCRTLSQLMSCRDWVINNFEYYTNEECCIGDSPITRSKLYGIITDMGLYLVNLNMSKHETWKVEYLV